MNYYRVELELEENRLMDEMNNNGLEGRKRPIIKKTRMINDGFEEYGCMFFADISESWASIGIIATAPENADKIIKRTCKVCGIKYKSMDMNEETINVISGMLEISEASGFIRSEKSIAMQAGIRNLCLHRIDEGEIVYDEDMARKITIFQALKKAEKLPYGDVLVDELNRIYRDTPSKKYYGFPVRYIVETDDIEILTDTQILLTNALYSNNRITNPRFGTLYPFSKRGMRYIDSALAEEAYECAKGCVMFFNLLNIVDRNDNDSVSYDEHILEEACSIAKKYAKDVLTVFLLPQNCQPLVDKIYDYMTYGAYIEFREEGMDFDRSFEYLKAKARERKIRSDKKLLTYLDKEKTYYSQELNTIFEEWFDYKLRNSIYKQYGEVASLKSTVAAKEKKGDAYTELNKMIGLKEAKKAVNEAISMHKAQKIYESKGLKKNDMSMHMCFTGNPGTAKTTVARLLARILKENDIIKTSHIVETGRADLVGKYVGWTAPTIKKKFKEASGGILFIDEAYSLVDDRNGSFGDEAINTIVQEMENHRDDVIVIFAGYPDKMEQFLDKNPGLRSRISFHVRFDDYSAEELCEITKLFAEKMGMRIEPEALDRIHDIMKQAVRQQDFGNGRFARNLIERARMAQANRLIGLDYDEVTTDDVATLRTEDIVVSDYVPKEKPSFGFVS